MKTNINLIEDIVKEYYKYCGIACHEDVMIAELIDFNMKFRIVNKLDISIKTNTPEEWISVLKKELIVNIKNSNLVKDIMVEKDNEINKLNNRLIDLEQELNDIKERALQKALHIGE